MFAKAWVAAGNAISGFKTCGVYSFNRSAIKVPELDNDSSESEEETNLGGNTEGSSDDAHFTKGKVAIRFSAEQKALFARRYEEGYDVYIDKDYVSDG